jgi:hypothetical protein
MMAAARCSECGAESNRFGILDHLPGCPIPGDAFFENFADAMRTGEPGPCIAPDDEYGAWMPRAYHVLDGDAVRTLREASASGGLTACLDCGKMIFVAGKPEAGIVVRGMPGGFNMKGVELE